jgi:hydroxymethylbilane synthase
VEYVPVETTGDRRPDVALHEIGGQGVFVKEVQRAVLEGRADLAVHSAKDLPSADAQDLRIGAYMARRDPRDVLVGRPLGLLSLGATVATGSVRRRAQLAVLRPDLQFQELRGNIHTRLERVPVGGAIVMAAAALEILGLTGRVAQYMSPDEMCPQVGQGTVAVECRSDDHTAAGLLSSIDHEPSRIAVEAERAYLRRLGSGCALPVGAFAVIDEATPSITLSTFLQGRDGVHTGRFTTTLDAGVSAWAASLADEARAAVGW